MPPETSTAICACGATVIGLSGQPILAATCHCTSCREAAVVFAALPGAPQVRAGNGGTPFVLWRSDRARVTRGEENLREYRLQPDAPTRRVVAICCNTPVYLQFTKGHWLSIYAGRFEAPPPTEMHTMVRDRGPGADLDDGLPAAQTQPARFMWRLLAAWAAMGFRTPKPMPLPPLEV